MPDHAIPEFTIELPTRQPAAPPAANSREDRVLGLRTKLEFFYAQMKRQQQQSAQEQSGGEQAQLKRLLDLIQIADSFEDVFRMCDESKKMRRQTQVRDAFATTFDALVELLENHHTYRVDILGKRYDEVQFQGVAIPEPWQVVESNDGQSQRVVRRVLRSLWVCVINNKLHVLRRAQVSY